MPLFMISRSVPEASDDDIRAGILRAVSCSFNYEGMRWITTYWDREHGKAYCLYEAKNGEQLVEHAERARVPCDDVITVECITPDDLQSAAGSPVELTPA